MEVAMQITTKEIERVISKKITSYSLSDDYLVEHVRKLDITCPWGEEGYTIQAEIHEEGIVSTCSLRLNSLCDVTEKHCDCTIFQNGDVCDHVAHVFLMINYLNPRIFPYHYDYEKKKLSEKEKLEKRERDRARAIEKQKLRAAEEMNMHAQLAMKKKELQAERRRLWREEQIRFKQEQEEEQKKKRFQLSRTLMLQGKKDIIKKAHIQFHGDIRLIIAECDIIRSFDKTTQIRFKIGDKRLYILKDIPLFLENIAMGNSYSYGKELTFAHTMDAFDEYSQEIIKYLQKSVQHSPYNDSILHFHSLKEKQIEEFFELCKNLPSDYCKIEIAEIKDKIDLSIQRNEDFYQLEWVKNEHSAYDYQSPYYFYKVSAQKIERRGFDTEGKTINLLAHLLDEKLFVEAEEMRNFYRYVLYDIRDHLHFIGDEEAFLIKEESSLKLYSDVNEVGKIYIKIECFVDDVQIHAFDKRRKHCPINLEIIEEIVKHYANEINEEKHIAYLDDHKETTYSFMKEGLPILASYCEVFVSDVLKNIGARHRINLRMGVSVSEGLLRVELQSDQISKDELFDVLKAYQRKRKFYRLKSGQLIYLESQELEELNQLETDLELSSTHMQAGTFDLPLYRAFHMEEIAHNDQMMQVERTNSFIQLMNSFQHVEQHAFDLPDHYDEVLRDYQKFGFQWLKLMKHYYLGGILADDMGLGKTLQVIALLESEKDKTHTSIVITPSSILLNWQDEIDKFTNNLSVLCILGSSAQRKSLIQQAEQYDVVITSYDYLRRDIDEYEPFTFFYKILDEAQYIKNHNTKNATVVKRLKSSYRLALTGTPIENSLAELWSIFDFLMPNYLYNHHYFSRHFERPIIKYNDVEAQKKLKRMIEPFILRRNKKDVLKELPDKVENTLHLSFQEEERKLYLANVMLVSKELQEQLNIGEQVNKVRILSMLTKLRQLCCEPRIVYENIEEPSTKLNGCMELVLSLKENKQKVLLFSSFTSVLDLIAKECQKYQISYCTLTGKTPKEERREVVQRFQDGDCDIFLISLKAGGTGLNLTRATAVIHYDPWWNISAQNQATDRAYRIGQDKNVQVFKLIMKDSIEEKIQNLQMKKQNIADIFVENNTGNIAAMDMSQIMDLFKI